MTAVDTGAMVHPRVEGSAPYAGPRSLRPGEPIYGRAREINDLRGAILSERIVLMYSLSGAGKSSLIEAGLRPELERRRFQVLPTIRVGYEPPPTTASVNRYRLSVITSLEKGRHLEEQFAPEELSSISLEEYLEQRSADEPDLDACLIFDQFEEVFTLDPTDWEEKEAFLRELGEALNNRAIFALFSMREDFIAQLDPFQALMPTRFRNRYRLELLGPSAAREAIQKPAAAAGVHFTDDAAERLVDDLRRVRVDRGTDSTLELGSHVEPVQLQVVCAQLWARLLPDATMIQPSDVVAGGNVNEALADYYSTQLHTVAGQTHVRERHIRDWFEEKLITDDGFRTQTREGPGGKGAAVLPALEDAHLIRADRRRGTQWYELTHDRFVDPIRAANTAFRARRRTKRTRRVLIFVAALVAVGFGVILAVAAGDDVVTVITEVPELPATEITENSYTQEVPLKATEVSRFRFEGLEGEEVMLVVTTDGTTSDLDIRLVHQVVPGDYRPVAPSGSAVGEASSDPTVEEASRTSTDAGAPADSTTSTTKAPLDTARVIERVFVLPADGSYLIEVSASNDATVTLDYAMTGVSAIPQLALDQTLEGGIDTAGAVARFGFAGGGDALELVLDSQGTFDGALNVLDADGNSVGYSDMSGEGQPEYFVGTLPAGSYTAEVAGFDGSTGSYTLTLRRAQTTPIALDETRGGSIDTAGAVGWFSFAGGGDALELVLDSQGTFDGALNVLDADGNSVGYSDMSGEGQPEYFVGILPAGSYTVRVAGFDGSTGSYALTLHRARTMPIALGEVVEDTGRIDRGNYYTFDGTGGQVYSITTSSSEIQATVFAPGGGVQIFTTTFVAPFDGNYLVLLEPLSPEDLTVTVTQPELTELVFGEILFGVVEASAQESAHVFAAEEGDAYTVTLDWVGESPPSSLYVVAPDGVLEIFASAFDRVAEVEAGLSCSDVLGRGLPYADAVLYVYRDSGEIDAVACEGVYPANEIAAYLDLGQTHRLTVDGTVPFDGAYVIVVGSFDPGSYELTLEH